VTQALHVTAKLLVGREGPNDGVGHGRVLGPTAGWRLFPAGTPSGHAATLYSMIGVLSAYFARPWLSAVLQVIGAVFCGTLLIDDYDFLSDLLWGAALGQAVGEWVVKNRSSRPLQPWHLSLTPVVDLRGGAVAVSVMARF